MDEIVSIGCFLPWFLLQNGKAMKCQSFCLYLFQLRFVQAQPTNLGKTSEKASFFWTLSKSGLDPPPPLRPMFSSNPSTP